MTPTFSAAASPFLSESASTSPCAFATISSMRIGWMRPSCMRRSRATRATWRRTGSNEESVTCSGVSSMSSSTPVAASRARMLRPSRPIRRPFISSLASFTCVTECSVLWSAATRCIAVRIMSRARSAASSCARRSSVACRRFDSRSASSVKRESTSVRAASGSRPATSARRVLTLARATSRATDSSTRVRSRSAMTTSRPAKNASRSPRVTSSSRRRSASAAAAARSACCASSASARSRAISPLAPITRVLCCWRASSRMAAALRFAARTDAAAITVRSARPTTTPSRAKTTGTIPFNSGMTLSCQAGPAAWLAVNRSQNQPKAGEKRLRLPARSVKRPWCRAWRGYSASPSPSGSGIRASDSTRSRASRQERALGKPRRASPWASR